MKVATLGLFAEPRGKQKFLIEGKIMKASKIILGSFILITLAASAAYAQQQFTQTVTKLNKGCNNGCSVIDVPELNDNPAALIFVTPILEKGTNLNPHPIGAYYMYLKKWSIFNLDNTPIAEGAKFKVEYYVKRDTSRFLYVVPKGIDACMDHAGLNDNPNATIKAFPTGPPSRGALFNRNEIKVEYDPASSKWCITNVNAFFAVPIGTAYSIAFSPGAVGSNPPKPLPSAPPSTPSVSGTATPQKTTTSQPGIAPGKTVPLSFGSLNDFAGKGLPEPAALPTQNLDAAAILMARQISKFDNSSLPTLLAALQAAGFAIIDEKHNILRRPSGDGKGQGLTFYDFEAVGSIKLGNRALGTSLDRLSGIITKNTPEMPASQFSALVLQEIREHSNSQNPYLRFWARLIIELGRASAKPVDLMTASPGDVNLSVLQASLLVRRLQGDLHSRRATPTAKLPTYIDATPTFLPAAWTTNNMSSFRRMVPPTTLDGPCNLDNDESVFFDGQAVLLTTWSNKQLEHVVGDKLGAGLVGANMALGWLKLVAALTMLHGEITVDSPPLIRTLNSTPGEKRLMKARIWSEVGKKEMLNCLRPLVNATTGLDFNMPSEGPLGNVAVEWHFAGDNEIRVNDAGTRNLHNFVVFQSPDGTNKNQLKQVTDDDGISTMWLVGTPKIPAVVYQKNPLKVEKQADVVVGVTLKSAKDGKQNWLDILGTSLGSLGAVAGELNPLGILGALPEIGFRTTWAAAWATIPVIDHEPCDGQWQGTITYTQVKTTWGRKTIIAHKSPMAYTEGGGDTSDETETFSGTISIDSSGANTPSASTGSGSGTISYDYIFTDVDNVFGKVWCSPLQGFKSKHDGSNSVTFASGSGSGRASFTVSLDKDGYKISITPPSAKVNATHSWEPTGFNSCDKSDNSHKGSSSSDTATKGSGTLYGSKRPYRGDDRNNLSDTSTITVEMPTSTGKSETSTTTSGGSVVTTITWNLRRCD